MKWSVESNSKASRNGEIYSWGILLQMGGFILFFSLEGRIPEYYKFKPFVLIIFLLKSMGKLFSDGSLPYFELKSLNIPTIYLD